MGGDGEVQKAATIMGQHQEHGEDLKPDRGYGKKSTDTRLMT
jgi:hypothetical protein